jgi:26S proteasome regulatory subunit N9
MVMKSMALKLVTGSIDQIKGEVTVGWVAPKVLEAQRISTMLTKFGEWEDGVKRV